MCGVSVVVWLNARRRLGERRHCCVRVDREREMEGNVNLLNLWMIGEELVPLKSFTSAASTASGA